ncbi:hypothetical protein [Streptomyces sp. WAC05858]|uniref:hypothetical protein n=1 Tax=Streptomyces TaxID=1883 RepID=UPI000F79E977|nr:hypothetical protein [Streptomyces sp. WAC05858]RSS32303.1 hypothetical protein EF902_46675 [Streptomyces sp. WAC05858]
MNIEPDLSDRNRCVVTHWELPVQCVLPPSHRDDHETWHPESGNRIRFCGESVNPYTEELYYGKWVRLYEDRAVLERLIAESDASIAALDEVLDVEAGLADILNRDTETKED